MPDEILQIDLGDDRNEAAGDAPFDADSLLITPALQQRIDLVEHLIEFGRQIIVMVGPSGIGKTNLLQVISNCEHENWLRLHYRGGPTLNAKTFAARLDLDLAADKPESDEIDIHLDVLRRRLLGLHRGGQLPVLFLDDADLLPMDAVQFVVDLAHTDDPETELHIVMTATAGRTALVDDLQRLVPNHAPVHVVELPRFNEAQTRALIEKLAEANAHPTPEAFADEKADEIHAASDGVPERIQVLTRQQLVTVTHEAPPTPLGPRFKLRVNPKFVAALGLMGAVVATGYWYAGRPLPPVSDGPHSLNVPPATGSVAVPISPAPTQNPIPSPEPALPPGQIAVPLPPPPPSGGTPPGVPAPEASVTPTPLPAPPAPAIGAPMPAPTLESAPVKQAEAPATAKSASIAAKRNEHRSKSVSDGESARTALKKEPPLRKGTVPAKAPGAASGPSGIAKLAPGTQVIQLFGSRDRAKAKRFIDTRGLADEAMIVASSLNGSPLYLVVYGQYSSRKAAQQALANLPAEIKSLKPWIRSAASLHAAAP